MFVPKYLFNKSKTIQLSNFLKLDPTSVRNLTAIGFYSVQIQLQIQHIRDKNIRVEVNIIKAYSSKKIMLKYSCAYHIFPINNSKNIE